MAHLTALELAPSDLVQAAAAAGFSFVGLRLFPAHPGGVEYDVRPGTAGHRELMAALDGEGLSVNDIEMVPLRAGFDPASLESLLETGAAVGARSLSVCGDDPDPGRQAETFGRLCDIARPLGMRVDLEFMRWRPVGTYVQAAAVVAAAGRPNGGVLVDALHLDRSGGTAATPDFSDGGPVRLVHLCDAPGARPEGDAAVIREAREGRLVPGEGALPLRELVARLQPDVVVSVESPDAGRGPDERLKRAAWAAKALLERETV